MKKTIIFSAIIFLIIWGISCEKTIEIDLEDAKIRLVVNAEMNPDSTIAVNVTRSRHILDNAAIEAVSNATVKLYEDDVFIGDLVYESRGFYKINYKPIIGKKYKIEVTHEKYDDVYAITEIPYPVEINKIDTIKTFSEWGDEIYNFSVKITDPAVHENYYMVCLRNRYTYQMWDDNIIVYDTLYVGPDTTIVHIEYGGYRSAEAIQKLWFESDDMIIEANIYNNNSVVFSDELFKGEQYALKLNIYRYSFYGDTNMVYIDLYSISPEYYKYLVSFRKHQDASGDPFSEPVMVFTNIVDGIGIFGAAAVNTDSIQIINEGGYYYYK
ncbi:MAG TPA: DUF4249 domain-containing protein [Bacteroidales bacterium]|nr:DUF4249 domain-containing protein [Bacteroidales bacterium]